SSYEWLFQLLEPLAQRVVLAHPKKLRVIAESTRKSDKLDAQVLAEFPALDVIPEAFRPTARQREHRRLVRQRVYLHKRITGVRSKIRWILTDCNADRGDLFTTEGLKYLGEVKVSAAARSVLDQLLDEWKIYLRWVLVETAWRQVYHSRRRGSVFEGLCKRRGRRRAIVAVARRLLCVMVAMLQSGRRYPAAMV
ncbi:MAG: hypothetical protein V1790_07985, partial [Planctomycetota bacterium]